MLQGQDSCTVRNPLTALPSFRLLRELEPGARDRLRALLMELRYDAARRADECWRRHKGPMAAYWRAVSVYAGHIARGLR